MGKAGTAQDNKTCKIKKSGRGLQSMAADQLCITPWSHWLIWERLLAAQISPSLLLRLPPHQPQLEPLSAGSYRVRQRKTQRASSPQVSSILYRGRLFDVNVSNPAHFRAKTANQVEERGREILEMEKWRGVGVLSFDPINLSETPKHFLLHPNFCVCFMKRARKKTPYIIYKVWRNPIRLSLCLVRIQLKPFNFTICRPLFSVECKSNVLNSQVGKKVNLMFYINLSIYKFIHPNSKVMLLIPPTVTGFTQEAGTFSGFCQFRCKVWNRQGCVPVLSPKISHAECVWK